MHECPALVRLLNEVVEHLLRHFEVGNHAVFQRPHNSDICGRAAQHLLGFRADRLHCACIRVLTVPKSIAKSAENKLNNGRRLLREIRAR
jgi:hypothetical protein